uniref:beta-ketoacyl-[acyl-carrier-protein] synthase I n=1 Tax=Triticum urartu TaxID=4572 RepID=A0A8R7PBV7_TRIUA
MAAAAPPLCAWLVAAGAHADCGADEHHRQQHRQTQCFDAGSGATFGLDRRPLGARRRGSARSGMAMSVALQPERVIVEKKRPDVKQRRVVVTGMGVVTPLGHDPDVFYNNLLDGHSGISEIETFDCSKFPTVIHG